MPRKWRARNPREAMGKRMRQRRERACESRHEARAGYVESNRGRDPGRVPASRPTDQGQFDASRFEPADCLEQITDALAYADLPDKQQSKSSTRSLLCRRRNEPGDIDPVGYNSDAARKHTVCNQCRFNVFRTRQNEVRE